MRVLVTGGAGFIGSNLADALLADGHRVRVLDDLSSGFVENVSDDVELLEGDVANERDVRKAVKGAEVVFHQAAHRAVLRSVEHPLDTDRANTRGTLTVLNEAAKAGVRRVIYASSSSVYGGASQRPTPESAPLSPRSPYAVTKLAAEHYCRVFSELYGLETVALRYFNVYGPRQRADSAYAAVIPLFIDALTSDRAAIVHGDGLQSRDFCYIDDVVAANLAAARAPAAVCTGKSYNVAGGAVANLLHLIAVLGDALGLEPTTHHVEPRAGDVRHSRADISAAARDLRHSPTVNLQEGLHRTVRWFQKRPGYSFSDNGP